MRRIVVLVSSLLIVYVLLRTATLRQATIEAVRVLLSEQTPATEMEHRLGHLRGREKG